jgi:hypothetical protein
MEVLEGMDQHQVVMEVAAEAAAELEDIVEMEVLEGMQ